MLIHLHWPAPASPDPSAGSLFTVVVAEADAGFAAELADVLRRDPRIAVLEVVTSAGETIATAEELLPDAVLVGELPDAALETVTQSIERLGSVAVILLVGPEQVRTRPPGVRGDGFLHREGTAEEVLSGFFEVASLAVRLRGRPAEEDD
jgi:DNA-binding NarL/FixJ family response regulator